MSDPCDYDSERWCALTRELSKASLVAGIFSYDNLIWGPLSDKYCCMIIPRFVRMIAGSKAHVRVCHHTTNSTIPYLRTWHCEALYTGVDQRSSARAMIYIPTVSLSLFLAPSTSFPRRHQGAQGLVRCPCSRWGAWQPRQSYSLRARAQSRIPSRLRTSASIPAHRYQMLTRNLVGSCGYGNVSGTPH